MTLFFAAVVAGATLRRCAVVVVGSRGVLVRLGGVLANRTGMGGAGSFVTRAIANALHAPDSDAHEPQQRARPRDNTEQGTDSRLSRNFHLQSLANLAFRHFEWVSQSLAARQTFTAASTQWLPIVGWKAVRAMGCLPPSDASFQRWGPFAHNYH
jgi:hypothetical protein